MKTWPSLKRKAVVNAGLFSDTLPDLLMASRAELEESGQV